MPGQLKARQEVEQGEVSLQPKKASGAPETLMGECKCHGVVAAASIVSVGLQWLRWTQEHKRRHSDVFWFRLSEPYVQQWLFFVFESTQIGGYNERERFGRESLGAISLLCYQRSSECSRLFCEFDLPLIFRGRSGTSRIGVSVCS